MSAEANTLTHAARLRYVDNPKIIRTIDNIDKISTDLQKDSGPMLKDAKEALANLNRVSGTVGAPEEQAKLKKALTDVAGGTVSMMFNDIAGATPLMKAGKLRALAITSKTRSPRLEGVPSLFESGFSGYELYNWVGIFAPARTSPEIVRTLAEEINRITARREFREQFERVGLDLVAPSDPAGFAQFVEREIANWSRQIKAAGIQPE